MQGDQEMARKHGVKVKGKSQDFEDDKCYGCGPNEWGENSEKVWAAIEESVRRFVEMNQKNIQRSDKEKIASASYSGGMIDMIMVIKNALGNWGVEMLLGELETWQKRGPPEKRPRVEVSVHGGPGPDEVTPEDARELGEKIADWIAKRKADGRNHGDDPMYA